MIYKKCEEVKSITEMEFTLLVEIMKIGLTPSWTRKNSIWVRHFLGKIIKLRLSSSLKTKISRKGVAPAIWVILATNVFTIFEIK
jgi:hypothetical protein